jgi:hypothetical protein
MVGAFTSVQMGCPTQPLCDLNRLFCMKLHGLGFSIRRLKMDKSFFCTVAVLDQLHSL